MGWIREGFAGQESDLSVISLLVYAKERGRMYKDT